MCTRGQLPKLVAYIRANRFDLVFRVQLELYFTKETSQQGRTITVFGVQGRFRPVNCPHYGNVITKWVTSYGFYFLA